MFMFTKRNNSTVKIAYEKDIIIKEDNFFTCPIAEWYINLVGQDACIVSKNEVSEEIWEELCRQNKLTK